MKIRKCSKCGQSFNVSGNFMGTILCEDCDPFMQDVKGLTDNKREENILAHFIRHERRLAEHDRDIADIKQQLEELKKQ